MPVSPALAYEIFYIELWHILSLLLILCVNYYIGLKARRTPLLYTFFAAQLMLGLWMIAKIGKTVSPTLELRWFFIVVQYFGVSFLGVGLLVFAYVYAKKRLPRVYLMVLWSLPALYSFTVVVTNPWHHRMYATFDFYGDTFGDLFYVNMGISYTYMLAAILLLSRGFFKMFGPEQKRARLFAAGIVFPLVINVLYITKLFDILFDYVPLFDYTPIATNVSLLVFTLAAFRYRFLDLLPVAGRAMADGLTDPVVLINRRATILTANKMFCEAFPTLTQGDRLPERLAVETGTILRENGRVYKISRGVERAQTAVRFTECTALFNMLEQLENGNAQLATTNEALARMAEKKRDLARLRMRGYVLQQLHDILGHAVVLAISSCEAQALSGAKKYTETLTDVKRLLTNSREELDTAWRNDADEVVGTSLVNRLTELEEQTNASGTIAVQMTIQGRVYEPSKEVSRAVFALCREGITNTLKHAVADRISIVVRFHLESVEVFIIDNGSGCTEIRYGKGLSGIRERARALNGYAEFFSDADCGFHIHMLLPCGKGDS